VTKFVNIWSMPKASADALAIGEAALTSPTAEIGSATRLRSGTAQIRVGAKVYGEALEIPWQEVRGQPWLGCAFAQTDLVRVNWLLRHGHFYLPGSSRSLPIPICKLGALGTLGPDGRDIHDGFERVTHRTNF